MYLYAITDQPDPPVPSDPGVEDTSLCSLTCQDIAAVVSPLATAKKVLPTEDNLWRHEAIVEALMADRGVLPVRFGTVLANEAAVQGALAAHYADFVASLDRMRGRVELGLRVLRDNDLQIADNSQQPSAISYQRPGLPHGSLGGGAPAPVLAPAGGGIGRGATHPLAQMETQHVHRDRPT